MNVFFILFVINFIFLLLFKHFLFCYQYFVLATFETQKQLIRSGLMEKQNEKKKFETVSASDILLNALANKIVPIYF